MALLARIGGPADVAAHPDQATKLLRGISRRLIADDDVTAVVASAKTSVGVPLVGLERDALMAIADDAYRAHRAFTTAKTKVDQLRTPREPYGAPGTRRRAVVTPPARALPMAPVALWPERINSLRHIARTCPPSRRAHGVLLSWVVYAARR